MGWIKSMFQRLKRKPKNDECNFDDTRPAEMLKELEIVDTPTKQTEDVQVVVKPKRKYTKKKKAKKKAKQ